MSHRIRHVFGMCVYDLGRALTKLGHRDNSVTQCGHPLTTNDSGR